MTATDTDGLSNTGGEEFEFTIKEDQLPTVELVQPREWSKEDRTVAAALLDVLWGVASYERMVVDWQMDPAEAIRGISWVMGLIRQAIVASPGGLAADKGNLRSPRKPF